jgi:hypothetical protein
VGDRDAVTGDEEADHDLGTVASVVAAVAVVARGEPRPAGSYRLEVGRRQVLTDQPEIEVRQVAELGVEMALGPLFASSERVDGPVAAVEARGADVFRQCHGCQPLGDRPTLRAGINQAVGQHHEDGVRERCKTAGLADGVEVRLEAETAKVRVAGGDTTEARPSLAGELAGLEPAPFGVVAKGPW